MAGLWQLERAEEKKAILAEQASLHANVAVPFSELFKRKGEAGDTAYRVDSARRYLRVVANGEINSDQTFFLDNRMRGGRTGYEVLSPLKVSLSEGEWFWLMINRGWLSGGLDRNSLPRVPSAIKNEVLKGYLYKSLSAPLMLAEDIWQPDTSPLVIQHFDQMKLESNLGGRVYPYVLRLDESPLSELKGGWIIVNVQPEKHIAYAVQWFAMALALSVLAVFANSNLGAWFASRTVKN